MKALLHFSASERLRARLSDLQLPRVVVVDENDDEGFAKEIADSDVLLHVLKPVTAKMIANGPKLRLIQKIGVGVDSIDLQAAAGANVAVANMPGTNTSAVCEHALALLLSLLRRIPLLDQETRLGRGWELKSDAAEAMGEVSGKTIGFVGYGAVPQHMTPALTALGARVCYWNRTPRQDLAATALSLEELLQISDVISLHLPLTNDTRHILNRETISRLKSGVVVVNTARGALIDQAAFIESLVAGRVAGAALDVFDNEPLDTTAAAALSQCRNVIFTPHVAWLTPETFERSLAVIEENCRRLQRGEELIHGIPLKGPAGFREIQLDKVKDSMATRGNCSL